MHRYFYGYANPTRYVDPTGHATQGVNSEVDEGAATLASIERIAGQVSRANPQITGAASEGARETTEPVVVDEDHGPLGNLVEGAAKRLSESWVGRKVAAGLGYVFDRLEAGAKKAGGAASGYAHSQAAEQDQVVRASKANASKALEGEYSQPIAQRNVGKRAEDVAADVAREGAERATREGVPAAVAAVAGKGLKALREIGSKVDDVPLVFRKDAAILAKEHATFLHDEYARWVLGSNAKQRTFKTPWSADRGLGTRRFDGFDRATGTYFEANTTPWSQMTQEQLSRKLNQVGSDWTLMQTNRSVNRVVWFGTEELPASGLGAQLRQALEKAEIPYRVVRP